MLHHHLIGPHIVIQSTTAHQTTLPPLLVIPVGIPVGTLVDTPVDMDIPVIVIMLNQRQVRHKDVSMLYK